ncbi:adenylate kinase [bacterium]|nr:adenylate kinase [bacterium]
MYGCSIQTFYSQRMYRSEIDVNRLSHIERVNVIGTSGSGKSTFGRQLAALLGLPFIEMDGVYWRPNWTEPTDEEFILQVKTITEGSRWVLDGNYSRSTPVKWRHVQLVVWLDRSFVRTVFRVSARCVKRSLTKVEIWPDTSNRETLRRAFLSRHSVILWAITSYRRNRRQYSEVIGSREYAYIWFVRLTSQREVNSFLEAARMAAEQSVAK